MKNLMTAIGVTAMVLVLGFVGLVAYANVYDSETVTHELGEVTYGETTVYYIPPEHNLLARFEVHQVIPGEGLLTAKGEMAAKDIA